MRLHPFRAIRPAPGHAAAIASPPYDVVSRTEAAALVRGNPESFLRVSRAEIDLPAEVDPHAARVYARGRENLDGLLRTGAMLRDGEPALFLYREVMDGRAQVGLVGCVHVDDYESGLIRKHEATRPDKEDDRTRHVLALDAQAEPVLLMYRGRRQVDALAAAAVTAPPLYDFTAPDGVAHTVWRIGDPAPWLAAFAAVDVAYVADGHHRSASAWRAARQRRAQSETRTGDTEYDWLLAVLFPAAQLRILAYNRLVLDLAGRRPDEVRVDLARLGRLTAGADPVPPRPGSFCFYFQDGRDAARGGWHRLELPEGSIDRGDPLGSLDVSLLQDRVLGPLLGIVDQRTDKRIDFVGGIRGTRALEARVDAGEAALAVSLHPTTVEQLMAVSDRSQMMPPKSTWFEPKLLSGLFVHPIA
ncbi:MAG TPA: DUF1015 family protein [Candidatus Bathyarchaeia archaeon]|nr:DUF1015 family protein [Candidatus Bathyarchaeia archaeon]